MAPRKRTTRQHKVDPRMAKLEAFLQDFDCEVETRVRLMKEKLKQLLKDVDNSYDMALLKMPKAIRQSSWLEHYKSEKPKSPLVDNTKREEEAATVDSVMVEDHAVLLKSVKKTAKKNGGARSSSDDENVPRTTRKGRTTKKPPSTSKRAKALSVTTQNTSIRRSNRRPLVTPARNMMDSSLMMGATPLFTPRFDPRLPKTPAVRVPRHKERVYSISVNGSPIAGGNEDIVINIPSGNGESLQLLASQINTVDLSQLDQTALKSIRLLQNHLSTLCGQSE
ncbi:borealin isoform X1 [Takifugu flavidus]|uniref:borealin isoform X1 n=1 Tax=Takifugu flavidus TaxID=433684 RepID=UPI0025449284|nr:borealin isoform X1 [Takifugu flavidus]